jgi:chromate transporter
LEVLFAFFRLGLTSFGGPIAHLGYFRNEFVERRRWLNDQDYSDWVALCQFLPGPASSQLGMVLGQLRAGWLGSLMAWIGFTLPSAVLLILFGLGMAHLNLVASSGAVHGLKLVAVAVVAQAVWGMAQTLCPDRTRVGLALLATLLTLALPTGLSQVGALLVSGWLGWWWLKLEPPQPMQRMGSSVSRRAGLMALALFFILLVGLPMTVVVTGSTLWALIDGFYRAGALVFGGGHVVLPLLQATVVPQAWVGNAEFLAGYGAAQAVPGPLFTFAAYLGAVMQGPLTGWAGGMVCLLVIFLPAWLLVMGAMPFWDTLRQQVAIRNAMAGVNAGVVGILLSALYDPVWTSAIHGTVDFVLALLMLGWLVYARVSPIWVVLFGALVGGLFL